MWLHLDDINISIGRTLTVIKSGAGFGGTVTDYFFLLSTWRKVTILCLRLVVSEPRVCFFLFMFGIQVV